MQAIVQEETEEYDFSYQPKTQNAATAKLCTAIDWLSVSARLPLYPIKSNEPEDEVLGTAREIVFICEQWKARGPFASARTYIKTWFDRLVQKDLERVS